VEDSGVGRGLLRYRLCPRCFRAVPKSSSEHYCINDGTWLLEGCPLCNTGITNPYARYCATCGLEFATVSEDCISTQRRF
jgi:hypothetical protein